MDTAATIPAPALTAARPRARVGGGHAVAAVVIVGVALRLVRYLANRSLWLDESMLALNIVDRPLWDLLTHPLTHHQGAPPLFLLLEKLAVTALGPSEFALRLAPMLAGAAAVVAFAAVARRLLPAPAAVLAVALLALDEMAIYYAAEVKQYSTDLLAACALALLALRAADTLRAGRRPLAAVAPLALAGVIAPWLSHPSVFVLAGAGLALFGAAVARKDRPATVWLAATGALWAASFAGVYVVNLRALADDPYLLAYWIEAEAFLPLVPSSAHDLLAWPRALLRVGRDVFAAPSTTAAAAKLAGSLLLGMALLGAVVVFPRRRAAASTTNRPAGTWRLDRALILTLPAVLTLLASAVGKYPIHERLALFLHPTVILLACAGIASLMPASSSPVSSEAGGENGVRDVNGPSERRTAGLPLLSIAVAAALLAYPLYLEAANAARPPGRDELRPLLHQIAADPATADLAAPPVLYTLAGARAATGYYLAHDPACAPLRRLILLHGPAEVWRQDQRDLDEAAVLRTQAPGTRRAWVLLSTTWHAQYAAQVERARQRFAAAGAKSVIELQAQGALAILYEFPASP